MECEFNREKFLALILTNSMAVNTLKTCDILLKSYLYIYVSLHFVLYISAEHTQHVCVEKFISIPERNVKILFIFSYNDFKYIYIYMYMFEQEHLLFNFPW